ncbi:MAG: acyl-CoA dehydrogenase [Gammaproteobacteria bacterium]|nr:acyl-CoA dehydrogenase [Gammaproteobacteria bacterium]
MVTFWQLLLLIALLGVSTYRSMGKESGLGLAAAGLFLATLIGQFALLPWLLLGAVAAVLMLDDLRREKLVRPVFKLFKKVLPPMTSTERTALEAGDVWWDGELFRGQPDWKQLHAYPKPVLNDEEQAFLDTQVEQLCAMLDDFKIVNEEKDLPPEVWAYIKKEGFFGMIIPKSFGGLGFSAIAHSTIVSKIATRSLTAAVTVMVPNSLGPAELLLHYGTDEQKNHYLPRLATGEEIPCFALTSPEAGSDAGAIPDKGIVCMGEHEGKETLGIRLTWNKRYITLAPVATVVGLAFKLYDPEHLLGDEADLGITCALIPRDHPGMEIGNRHIPMYTAFMNGVTRGKDVFIPIDWIIGGPSYAGQGWRMLMECLSAGRAISLPALATATGKLCYRMTGAYARLRKQFKMAIGQFEGVEEALARIAGFTYQLEAARVMTAGSVDLQIKPSVPSAIAKYHMTEMGRKVINDAMDVHGGRGVIAGERNYLAHGYMGTPISITVEGANILTRNLMIFGQGAVRCHPFVFPEMEAAQNPDFEEGLRQFDKLLMGHVAYGIGNFFRTLIMALTAGRIAKSPVTGPTAPFYQQLTRMSAALALVSDMAMMVLGGDLKRRERLSARLGDVLSQLYLASAVLKYYQDQGSQAQDLPYVRWCVKRSLWEMQHAFDEFLGNFPNKILGTLLRWTVFPYGKRYLLPSDRLDRKLVAAMLDTSEIRERITQASYTGKDDNDITGRMENAFQKVLAVLPLEKRIGKAVRDGQVEKRVDPLEVLRLAVAAGVISEDEAELIKQAEAARSDAIQVDDYSQDYVKGVQAAKPAKRGKAA